LLPSMGRTLKVTQGELKFRTFITTHFNVIVWKVSVELLVIHCFSKNAEL
jgi:hypothetical protein